MPPNLFLIGTANSADRSIALIDFALRRRFAFFNFTPRSDVLIKFLSDYPPKGISVTMVVALFEGLNRKIAESKNLGAPYEIGHSYFMEKDMTTNALDRIWRTKLVPLLEEYYFDAPDELADFQSLVKWVP